MSVLVGYRYFNNFKKEPQLLSRIIDLSTF